MFFKDDLNVYRVGPLAALKWLDHGFGTAQSPDWSTARSLTTVKQIHSNLVLTGDRPGRVGEGDALIADHPGSWVGVRTADCVPLLFADTVRRAVAAVHAGWRGTAAGISVSALEAMADRFGTRPEDLVVAIGPAIGGCCYEVGPEVAEQFGMTGRLKLDLPEANRTQLAGAGVPPERIFVANLCTACLAGEFHSYRRDRSHGRMVSAIGVRG